jgi:hypothetical protein
MLTTAFAACKKDKDASQQPPPPPPSFDDRATVFLKDVVESGLPSPYFHFSYNDSGYVTNISFADGFFDYDVNYNNRRVAFMLNKKNNARLDYFYTNGRVSSIDQVLNGEKLWSYKMTYAQNRLAQVRWLRFPIAGDSVVERKIELFYGTDGNLSEYKDYRPDNGNGLKLSRTFQFSQYDGATNVDDFYVFKNFFEDVIFLPGVKLQKNNPRLVRILGEQNDFEITYTYNYRDNKPILKNGIFKQTRGGGSGETSLVTSYTYYQ